MTKIVKRKANKGLGLISKGPGALGSLRSAALSSSEYREALGLTLDCSASMTSSDKHSVQRIVAVKLAVENLLSASSPNTSRILVSKFSHHSSIVCPLTNRYQMVREAIASISPNGGTKILPALEMTTDVLRLQEVIVRRIIVLSDGEAWDEDLAIAWAIKTKASYRLPIIDTIYFNSTDNGKNLMVTLAEISGGKFYYASDADQLAKTFKQLDVKTRGLLTDGK